MEDEQHRLKILVTGAGGLFGSAFASLASKSHTVLASYRSHLPPAGQMIQADLEMPGAGAALLRDLRPQVVVHAASLTDLDVCEENRALADRLNREVAEEIATAAREVGAFVVYVSTDYVFDGTEGMYGEDDRPNPVNYYGLTKLRGEVGVSSSGADFAVVRASVIYGAREAAGKSNSLLWLLNKLRDGQKPPVVTDQFVSPTLNTSLAEQVLEVAERRLTGVFHVSGAERVSRLGFAEGVCEVFGFPRTQLQPVSMDRMAWRAKRPKDTSLDVSKAARTLRSQPLALIDALGRVKQEMKL